MPTRRFGDARHQGDSRAGRIRRRTYTCAMAVSRNAALRATGSIAVAFSALALLAALLSVLVMISRPWGCSMSSDSPNVSCDWVTSRWIGAAWLVVVLGISVIAWKRWTIALAAISLPLLGFSMLS